ncbi:RNA polymerase sigma factor SigI [Mesobacillus foraminis]|uniref:RNA polymerase sigma factor SigI n=1 Tax=Mesobacillus foraminis TaxID=279826 RepID=UPI0039A2F8C0
MRLMLSLLFLEKKKQKTLEEKVVLIQQGDLVLRDDLIKAYKPFIAKSVSTVCKRYISQTDDEFSIGLIAFNEAIEKYSPEKGNSLLSFADILIKRRVIDFIRQQSRNQAISMNFGSESDEDENHRSTIIDAELSIESFRKKTDEERRREEIVQFQHILKDFGLSFKDLVDNSPKHADARRNAMEVAKILSENQDLKDLLLEKKRLPIKQLENLVDLSRKTIERNRKYIIAVSLILIGDYIYLKDYIKGVLDT